MNTRTSTHDTAAPHGPDSEHPHRYTAQLADAIETRWQAYWLANRTFCTPNPGDADFDSSRRKYFCLDMFPYPSGAGLHVGHPEGYTATDIICRYRRLLGDNVLHPMGWDAFGLPAEQYAIQTNVHPAKTTVAAIDNFRRQLQRFGFSYDWEREFATIDESYYRWTQWIWLQAYDAWYDPAADRARPIDTLIPMLEAGEFLVDADDDLVRPGDATAETAVPWTDLEPTRRRRVLDRRRLAYLDEQMVNWCPKLGTVLANEEVIDGTSERGGYPVYRRPLKQWMFRITAYAERLLRDLTLVEWPESTLAMQAAWIGRSEGADVDFPLASGAVTNPAAGPPIRVYTTRPDTLFGATFMVLAPEHPLVETILSSPGPNTDLAKVRTYVDAAARRSDRDRMAETREKTGVDTGWCATNPATGAAIPIWIADYVLMGYGHGAIMAVPAHDERDGQFARQFGIPIIQVVDPPADAEVSPDGCYAGDGTGINSANDAVSLNGLATVDAKARIIQWLEASRIGKRRVNFRLRDWLFSRQRYWGEPFPIVYDEDGNTYPVDQSNLPVTLPSLDDFKPVESEDPTPLLAKATHWVNTTAGAAGVDPTLLAPNTPVTRETNTMPGWAGSCWYYLRYCDPHNEQALVSPEAERYWMGGDNPDAGVDLYIGGAEHAVLHLLYARFWHKLLFDLGVVTTPEPFAKLFHQGMITSFAYQRADKSLVPVNEVTEQDGAFTEIATGQPVVQTVAKMSKSLKNVVNPDDVIAEFGADTFRLYEMYMGPLDQTKPWNPRDIAGPYRFLQRLWRLAIDEKSGDIRAADQADDAVERQLHRTIEKVAHDIQRLAFNTAIAAIIELVNTATASGGMTKDQLQRLAIVISPFAPHCAEEIWSRLGRPPSIAHASWPQVDREMLTDATIELPVQIHGKVRARITVASDADTATIEAAALADQRIADLVKDKVVKKVIVVPGRIVNVIVG